jgi:hypothetical protein
MILVDVSARFLIGEPVSTLGSGPRECFAGTRAGDSLPYVRAASFVYTPEVD